MNHPHAHLSPGEIIMGAAFAILLGTILCAGLAILSFVFVNFIFKAIRGFLPNFGMPKHRSADGETLDQTRATNKKIALDWLISESMRRRQVNVRREAIQYGAPSPPSMQQNEWDLNAIKMLLEQPGSTEKPENRKDLYTLSLITDHRKLCFKTSTKNGLKVAFANLNRKNWIVFDYESAKRWQTVLPNTEIVPANVYARLRQRQQEVRQKEIVYEKANAATA